MKNCGSECDGGAKHQAEQRKRGTVEPGGIFDLNIEFAAVARIEPHMREGGVDSPALANRRLCDRTEREAIGKNRTVSREAFRASHVRSRHLV